MVIMEVEESQGGLVWIRWGLYEEQRIRCEDGRRFG